jgi:transposase
MVKKFKKLTIQERCYINTLYNQGSTMQDIQEITKFNIKTVKKWAKREKPSDIKRIRKNKITKEIEDFLISHDKRTCKGFSSRRLVSEIKERFGLEISHTRLNYYIKKLTGKSYKLKNIKKLTHIDKQKRISFAQDCLINKTKSEKFLFTDEKIFNLYPELNTQTNRVRILNRKLLSEDEFQEMVNNSIPSKRTGFLVSAGLSIDGATDLIFIVGNVDSSTYIKILDYFKKDLNGKILIEDNASSHRSEVTRKYKEELGINYLFLPPSSPDLNMIENLWAIIMEKLAQQTYNNLDDLKLALIKT